jgi:hypothetical protein
MLAAVSCSSCSIDFGLLIALAALLLTLQQLWATRNHNRLSVRPVLVVRKDPTETGKDHFRDISVYIQNVGLGPAYVNQFEMLIDGHVVEPPKTEREKLDMLDELGVSPAGKIYTLDPKSTFTQNEKRTLLTIERHISREQLEAILGRINYRVRYESGYHEGNIAFFHDDENETSPPPS